MAIEDVAEAEPEKIFKLAVSPTEGLTKADLKGVADNLGIGEHQG